MNLTIKIQLAILDMWKDMYQKALFSWFDFPTPPPPQISASLPEIQFWWLGRHRPAFARMNSNHFHPPFWLWWIITSWGNDFLVFVPETGSHRVAQAARHLFYAHNDTDFCSPASSPSGAGVGHVPSYLGMFLWPCKDSAFDHTSLPESSKV